MLGFLSDDEKRFRQLPHSPAHSIGGFECSAFPGDKLLSGMAVARKHALTKLARIVEFLSHEVRDIATSARAIVGKVGTGSDASTR
jgi:hypothetical protein